MDIDFVTMLCNKRFLNILSHPTKPHANPPVDLTKFYELLRTLTFYLSITFP